MRLREEKLELWSQAQEITIKIETKQNEIDDLLKYIEIQTKETAITVRNLIDSKTLIEEQKRFLENKVYEMINERNKLKKQNVTNNALENEPRDKLVEAMKQNYSELGKSNRHNQLRKEESIKCEPNDFSTDKKQNNSMNCKENQINDFNLDDQNTRITIGNKRHQTPTIEIFKYKNQHNENENNK